MSKSRIPLILGLGAAGGIGYYLYSSGGNAQAAEKKFESDLHKARANIRSAIPGTGSSPDAANKLETAGSEAGAKLDKAWQKADQQVGQARDHAEAYAKDARAEALKAVDKFDKTVENGASKAKSGISSWFGGK
ncbi:hypothetical protein MY11210_003752 [Beauveria gryllotalpidicola]